MKITFLGTNGWYDTDTGSTVSILIDSKDDYIILDAGFGFYKLLKILKDDKPISLLLSHMHLDHIIGLHTLPLFARFKGIDIYTPPGAAGALKIFLDTPYTTPFSILSKKVNIYEIDKKAPQGFGVVAKQLLHAVPCYGFRIAVENKIITYCTDTGRCENLNKLAAGADLLITECSFKPGETDKERPFHLNPGDAAEAAKESGAKRLVLTHFDPGRYPSFKERTLAEEEARIIFKNTIAAKDGYQIRL